MATITHEIFNTALEQITHEPSLKLSLLYTLSRMEPESWHLFQTQWPQIVVQRRREIMQSLVDITEANFEVNFNPVFRLALQDADAEVRTLAVNGLWEEENPNIIPPLMKLLHQDDAPSVRAAAAIALGRFIYLSEIEELEATKGTLVKDALLNKIYQSNEDIEVRRRAIEAVAFASDEAVTRIIETAYYDDSELMQVSAVFAMGRSADVRWTPYIIRELDNSSTAIRFEAARACGELEISPAVNKLIALLEEEEDLEIQEVTIWALGRIGGDTAREALEICLESDIELIAMSAKEALEELTMFSDTFNLFDFEDDWPDDLDEFEFDEFDELDSINGKHLYH